MQADNPGTDVIIVGAGAAGLMCAIEAGKRKRSVLILDHSPNAGRKIRASGGGRCNFTNINLSSDNYLSNNPHFCKSALSRLSPNDFIRMLEKHGIGYYEKEDGQMFCKSGSKEILLMLQSECKASGVKTLFNCNIENIKKTERYIISTDKGIFESKSLVIATGGLSYPNLGATDIGHRVARQFGLNVISARPALAPLSFGQADRKAFSELAGVSINAVVQCNNKAFRGSVLFTYRGLSGPAILQISSYWNKGDTISINLLPDMDAHELLLSKRQSRMEMKNLLSKHLPARFAERWSEIHLPSKPLCQFNERELSRAAESLQNWEICPDGIEGYKTAEVTRGGVETDELSSKTMEAKKAPGLYFAGEVIDVTGQLGGYNLHWAWASGFVAGQYV
ncbi:MAG: NAD(P)/FAD-dependent oxidoreductase [Nitrospirae bacterium]|nr:MAG: NAD(P)/FAD-dependent oxidoreductase [Nitrospirota bacterium]